MMNTVAQRSPFSFFAVGAIYKLFGILTLCLMLTHSATAAELFWFAGTSGTYPTGGATWDTSNLNWSTVTPPSPQILPPADPWNLANGPTNIARFNIDNDVASISGTVYPSSIRFSGDDAVVNGSGLIGFATPTSIFTLRSDAGKAGIINADFGTLATAPVGNNGNVIAKTFAGNAVVAGNAFLYGTANQNNTTAALSVEGGGELNITGFVKLRSISQVSRSSSPSTVGSISANNTLRLSGTTGSPFTDNDGVNSFDVWRLEGTGLTVGGGTFGGNSVILETPGSLSVPTYRMLGNSAQLNLGVSSSSNSFTVQNGAYLRQSTGGGTNTWTVGTNTGADSNSILITGTGSTIDRGGAAGSAINVGAAGSSNSLTINAGGTLIPRRLGIGTNGGDNNFVLVTGSGSFLDFNTSANAVLQIGASGSASNSLRIENSGVFTGTVSANNSNFVGSATGADNNYILVTGAGSSFSYRQGTPLTFGGVATGGTITDSLASGNHLDIFAGATSSLNTVYLQGVNSTVNLGNGIGTSELTVAHSASNAVYGSGIRLTKPDSTLNINSGRLIADAAADAAGNLVSGPGQVHMLGNSYFETNEGTLRQISSQITGVGDFHKEGTGTLALTSLLNDYSGDTYVDAGVLQLNDDFLDDASSVYLYSAGSAKMNLNFSGNDTIAALYFDDVLQPAGTYGRVGSAATFQNHTFFNDAPFPVGTFGDGLLNVTGGSGPVETVPEPSTLALAGLGLIGLALVAPRQRWNRSRTGTTNASQPPSQ